MIDCPNIETININLGSHFTTKNATNIKLASSIRSGGETIIDFTGADFTNMSNALASGNQIVSVYEGNVKYKFTNKTYNYNGTVLTTEDIVKKSTSNEYQYLFIYVNEE